MAPTPSRAHRDCREQGAEDGSGNVTRVDIVEAHPRRVFDTAVASALAQWKFNDGAAGRTYDTEVVFQR